METSRYDEIKLQADTIRHELGRVVAVRAMNLLVGANTFANLKENPKYAFRLLSQAYGLIYASQFVKKRTRATIHCLRRNPEAFADIGARRRTMGQGALAGRRKRRRLVTPSGSADRQDI